MKFSHLFYGLCCASLVGSTIAIAQPTPEPPAIPAPPSPAPEQQVAPAPAQPLNLREARKAAENDPTVRSLYQAREALDKQIDAALNAAVIAANPALASEVENVKDCKDRAKNMRRKFDSLSPEQRESLKAARQAAKEDPAVVAAREKVKAATSPEEKQAAMKELFKTRHAAMIRQNPDLASILDQLGPPPMHGEGDSHGDMNRGNKGSGNKGHHQQPNND